MSSVVYIKEIANALADLRQPDPNTDPEGHRHWTRAKNAAIDAVSTGITPKVTSEDAGNGATIRTNMIAAKAVIDQGSPDPAIAGSSQAETNRLNALRLQGWQTISNKIDDIVDEVQADGQLSATFVSVLEAENITWSTKP